MLSAQLVKDVSHAAHQVLQWIDNAPREPVVEQRNPKTTTTSTCCDDFEFNTFAQSCFGYELRVARVLGFCIQIILRDWFIRRQTPHMPNPCLGIDQHVFLELSRELYLVAVTRCQSVSLPPQIETSSKRMTFSA